MRSILEEFAYGNVSPQAQYFDKNSKYGRAIELVAEIEEKLLDRLGAEDRDLFENMSTRRERQTSLPRSKI